MFKKFIEYVSKKRDINRIIKVNMGLENACNILSINDYKYKNYGYFHTALYDSIMSAKVFLKIITGYKNDDMLTVVKKNLLHGFQEKMPEIYIDEYIEENTDNYCLLNKGVTLRDTNESRTHNRNKINNTKRKSKSEKKNINLTYEIENDGNIEKEDDIINETIIDKITKIKI